MSGMSVQYSQPLANYLRVKKLQIFPVLKRLDFSGQLIWSTPAGQRWTLFFNCGQVVYGKGGVHPMRQWYRQAQTRLPEANLTYQALQSSLAGVVPNPSWLPDWDYHLLHSWLGQGQLSEQALQAIHTNIVADILFDVVQAHETQYQLARHPPLAPSQVPVCVDDSELLPSVIDLWETWREVGLEAYSPNLAPVIQHPEPIQAAVSPRVYESLMQLLDGQRSLRDLAVKLGQDVVNLTQALHPYIQSGWISLVEVADFPAIAGLDPPSGPDQSKSALKIACVDDSPMVCKAMGQVIRAAGYDFLAITEGAKAIPTLLAQRPDLVFLDLVMPDTNGYEICSNLRKISRFKDVPIVILSGNDGLVDQVRARLLGATDFLSKPMEPIVILSVIRKHLAPTSI